MHQLVASLPRMWNDVRPFSDEMRTERNGFPSCSSFSVVAFLSSQALDSSALVMRVGFRAA